jgi:hypothetical protein
MALKDPFVHGACCLCKADEAQELAADRRYLAYGRHAVPGTDILRVHTVVINEGTSLNDYGTTMGIWRRTGPVKPVFEIKSESYLLF